MKKRLLSAALALAMVLTLLPVSAFAVTTTSPTPKTPMQAGTYTTGTAPNVQTHSFYDVSGTNNITQTVTLCTGSNEAGDGRVYGHWYWLDNKTDPQNPVYYEVNSGIVTGTGGSGQWYEDVAAYSRTVNGNTTVNGAFTVLSGAVNLSSYTNSSLTINFVSNIGALTIPNTLTSLTLTGKYQDANASGVMGKGQVDAINIDRSVYDQTGVNSGLTINANNVNITSIDLSGRANTLNLTDCTVGDITLDGEATTNTQGTKSWSAQTVTANNSTVGAIKITNANGGGVTLNNTKGGKAVNFTSDGGSIRVTGASNVGAITVAPRTNNGSYASVTITGGTVGGVTQSQGSTNVDKPMNITVSGSTTNFGTINAGVNGTVSITDADGTAVTVDKGSLTIGGSGVNISGAVTLAADAATRLTMSASNSTFGSIVSTNGTALTISTWNGKRYRDGGNNYGTLSLGTYDGRGITGGTFSATNADTIFGDPVVVTRWLKLDDLLLYAKDTNVAELYGKKELPRAVSDYGVTLSTTAGTFTALGQAANKVNLTIMNGKNPWALIGYNQTTPIILPDMINGMTITKWYGVNNHDIELNAGVEVGVPFRTGGLTLNATGSVNTAVSKITKATATASIGSAPVVNQNVTATLTGNNIHVTGAVVPGVGGIATVYVDLETDVVKTDGTYMKLEGVAIDCYMKDGKLTKVKFNDLLPETIPSDIGVSVINGELVLGKGTGAHYTVTANVTESASRLGIAPDTSVDDSIVVTFGGKLASLDKAQKEAYAKDIAEGGQFTYGLNQAMQQAINAAQATITANNTVQGWITNAQNTIWRQGYTSPNQSKNTSNFGYMPNMAPNTGTFNGTTASGAAILGAFDKAYIVPYLAINVTEYDPVAGTMTATLTPSYRVDVSASTGYVKDVFYTVQAGRPLTLTGSMTNAPVTVKFGTSMPTVFATRVMHQDGKYAYTGAATTWKITHLGANGTLGTVVINANPGLIEIDSTATDKIANRVPTLTALGCKYDTLQAAIDDTVRGSTVQTVGDTFDTSDETMDTVVISGQYTGSAAITMTGTARKVKVIANGQHTNTVTASGNVEVNKIGTQSTGGYVYTVELKQDTAVVGDVTITVTENVNGTASLSANPAKAGQTVTVTVQPKAGVTTTGVTAKTNTGDNVPVSATTTPNQYTFTVPTGATSIVVTPTFNQGVTKATVNVAANAQGSVTTTAAATDNKVDSGSTVGVTTYPGSGYRTMGVNITTNGGATSANRVSDNSFTFTVPINATSVTVTPVYDRDNGTKFTDVWSTEYYSNAVSWAVSKGITNGQSTYLFGSNNYCTRGEMVTFLWRAANSPTVGNVRNPFVDVNPGDYYYDAVLWAVSKGITDGIDATHFGPKQYVTRAQTVTFLYRYENSPAASTSNGFYDVSTKDYFAKAVTWAANKGITNGKTNTSFAPNDACKRCEIVTFLYRDVTGNRA